MKILPLVLALALLAPTTTWGEDKPGKQKGNSKGAKANAPQRGRPAQAARPQRAARPQQQRASRPQVKRAPRIAAPRNRQVQRAPRAAQIQRTPAIRLPGNRAQRPVLGASGAVRAQRPVIAVRDWRGAGTYGNRYWSERPRYQYNGSWFFYGFGPLPYYDNYDNFYPTYDPIYTGRIVTTTRSSGANDDLARRAQSALSERGLYRGQIDGQFGPASQRALRAYQESSGLPVTGEIDAETIASLGI